jgi:predicted DCC family thiol-disulfide oxidoreductase YuxK
MPAAQQIISLHKPDAENYESVILVSKGNLFIKSDAALNIATGLGGIYKLASLLFIFPKGLRNFVYDFIARKRYSWFGKRDRCYVPDEKVKSKFL